MPCLQKGLERAKALTSSESLQHAMTIYLQEKLRRAQNCWPAGIIKGATALIKQHTEAQHEKEKKLADENEKYAEDLREKVTFRRTGPKKFDWVVEMKPDEWYELLRRHGVVMIGGSDVDITSKCSCGQIVIVDQAGIWNLDGRRHPHQYRPFRKGIGQRREEGRADFRKGALEAQKTGGEET